MESQTIHRLLTRLKQLRERHGLTQEQFAEGAGISYKYYQAVEAGRKLDLRLSTIERLADAYGLEAWELIGPKSPKTTVRRAAAPKNPPHYRRRAREKGAK